MNYKVHVCMVNKNKFSTLVVKAFKSFQIFPGLPASLGRAVGVLELEGSGWPRYVRLPPAGSPSPGSPSVSLGYY